MVLSRDRCSRAGWWLPDLDSSLMRGRGRGGPLVRAGALVSRERIWRLVHKSNLLTMPFHLYPLTGVFMYCSKPFWCIVLLFNEYPFWIVCIIVYISACLPFIVVQWLLLSSVLFYMPSLALIYFWGFRGHFPPRVYKTPWTPPQRAPTITGILHHSFDSHFMLESVETFKWFNKSQKLNQLGIKKRF